MLSYFTEDDGPGHTEAAAFRSLPATPKLVDAPRDQAASDEDIGTRGSRPFDVVSRRLKDIGAISLENFLSAKPLAGISLCPSMTKAGSSDVSLVSDTKVSRVPPPAHVENQPLSPSHSPPAPLSEWNLNGEMKPGLPLSRDNAISRLHQTCIHALGSSDPLKYEFLEENGQKSKQCILTITRPDRQIRTYKSEPLFLRRADAKARVATIAMQMGALSFILNGNSEPPKAKKGVLSPSPGAMSVAGAEGSLGANAAVCVIENGLMEWRAGKIRPEWVFYNDARVIGHYGAALKIQLTSHSSRVYSCDSTYSSEADARVACAQKALEEGVLDYIKFGNGQTEPAQLSIEDKEPDLFDQQRPSQKGRTRPMTLQSYYDSLPRPFPESFGDKVAVEINAPSYINTLLQSARGGRIKYNFYWIVEKSTGLLGCLLRLERGNETKSYLVDRQFQKRNDAKAAACLLALSQGLGDYIRSVKASMDAKFTPEMRKLASEKFIFALNTECSKIRQGNRLNFIYSDDLDAFGASLEINISSNLESPDTRKWTVPPEYRSKNDAKLAVCYQAVAQGAIEVLQFRGGPLPPGHVSYWDAIHGREAVSRAPKRKSAETDIAGEGLGHQRKRRKDWQRPERDMSKVVEVEPGEITEHDISSPKATILPRDVRRPAGVKPRETDFNSAPWTEPTSHFGPLQEPVHWPGSTGGSSLAQQGGYPTTSPGMNFAPLEALYYPTSTASGPHHPISPQTLSDASSSVYYHPAPVSPVSFTTYHLHHSIGETQFVPHPPMYPHPPHFIPPYPQPAASPYHSMPSPYHSPYPFSPSSPLYLPQSPDNRPMDMYDCHTDIYYRHSPEMVMQPMSLSPPSPPRPQKIKRINRNAATSPLEATRHTVNSPREEKMECGMENSGEMTGLVENTGGEAGRSDPAEETEAEEEELMKKSQVLERRASMP